MALCTFLFSLDLWLDFVFLSYLSLACLCFSCCLEIIKITFFIFFFLFGLKKKELEAELVNVTGTAKPCRKIRWMFFCEEAFVWYWGLMYLLHASFFKLNMLKCGFIQALSTPFSGFHFVPCTFFFPLLPLFFSWLTSCVTFCL